MSFPVEINGKQYHKGSRFKLSEFAAQSCGAPEGLEIDLVCVNNGEVGIQSLSQNIPQWHELGGRVPSHRGWWMEKQILKRCIDSDTYENQNNYEISKKLSYKGVELRGKQCKILFRTGYNTTFVEFKDNIDGCSADGLGKTGHCIAVKPMLLKRHVVKKHKKVQNN